MTSDNVYLSISFANTPRSVAEAVVKAVEAVVGDNDFSVDYGDPIGDASPTPVADETADAVGGDPTAPEDPSDPDVRPGVGDSLPPVVEPQQPTIDETPLTVDNGSGITVVTVDQPAETSDSTDVVTGEAGSPVADEGTDTPAPVVPDIEPDVEPDAPVDTSVDTPAPVVPDVEPTDAPALTATDTPTADDGPQLPGLNVPPPAIDQSSGR